MSWIEVEIRKPRLLLVFPLKLSHRLGGFNVINSDSRTNLTVPAALENSLPNVVQLAPNPSLELEAQGMTFTPYKIIHLILYGLISY